MSFVLLCFRLADRCECRSSCECFLGPAVHACECLLLSEISLDPGKSPSYLASMLGDLLPVLNTLPRSSSFVLAKNLSHKATQLRKESEDGTQQ